MEVSEGGKAELKAAVIDKIKRLLTVDSEVRNLTFSMIGEVRATCLPDIVVNHIVGAMESNQRAVARITESQIEQLKKAALLNGILVDDAAVLESIRPVDENPEPDLPSQEFNYPDGDPDAIVVERVPLAVSAVRHGKPKKRAGKKRSPSERRKSKRSAS